MHTQRLLRALCSATGHVLQAQIEAISIPQQELVESFQATLDAASLLRSQIRTFVHAPTTALPFLQPGRLVRLLADPEPAGTGTPLPSLFSTEQCSLTNALPSPDPRLSRSSC